MCLATGKEVSNTATRSLNSSLAGFIGLPRGRGYIIEKNWWESVQLIYCGFFLLGPRPQTFYPPYPRVDPSDRIQTPQPLTFNIS